jgi:uncharacterized protein YbjT (DUF2867 family)
LPDEPGNNAVIHPATGCRRETRMATSAELTLVLTGATGLVGEGVLLACLSDPAIARVLAVGRRASGLAHPKLSDYIVDDFGRLDAADARLAGFDACFYCAGITSRGMTEADYTRVTYEAPLHVARTLLALNPRMALCHISGAMTDSTEQGRVMWARVKGRAENALSRLGFARAHHFRPGLLRPTPGQVRVRSYYRAVAPLYPILRLLMPGQVCTVEELGAAMIETALHGFDKPVLEVPDITSQARRRAAGHQPGTSS